MSMHTGNTIAASMADREETFELTPKEEADLLLAIGEADRGETFSAEEVLDSLTGPRR